MTGIGIGIMTAPSQVDYRDVLQSIVSSVAKSIVVAMYGCDDDMLVAILDIEHDTALKQMAANRPTT